MQFGIEERDGGIYCANCHTKVTDDDFFAQKFCVNCGSPLKKSSADAYMETIAQEQIKVIDTIRDALPKHDIQKILTDLREELTEKKC